MKKYLSFFLAIILAFVLIQSAGAYSQGKYIVNKNYTQVYAGAVTTAKIICELTKNTYIEIVEVRDNGMGKCFIAMNNTYGWVNMADLTPVNTQNSNTNITAIEILQLPTKLIYVDGLEELDLTGLKVCSIDTDGKKTEIFGYDVYTPLIEVAGKKSVTVTYSPNNFDIFKTSFEIEVIKEDITGISIASFPKTQYKENQPISFEGLTINVSYKDSSKNKTMSYEEIASNPDFTIIGCHEEAHNSPLAKGEHIITVQHKYEEISCSFIISASARKLTGLTIKSYPEITDVYSNEELPAIDGLILEATYDNGEVEEVYHYNCKVVCNPSDFIVGPGNEVDVYFGEKFVTISFRYFDKALPAGIRIKTPTNLTFYKGEEIDLSTLEVMLYYTDGTYDYIDDYTLSEINYSIMGSQSVSVSYGNYSEVFSIYITKYFSKGDVTGDGNVTAADARMALRASVKLVSLSGITFFAADADRDGKITANDARLILRTAVKLDNLYITLEN